MVDGKPDLDKVKAFIGMGNMGIVYEANQWHSPMCALDEVYPTFLFEKCAHALNRRSSLRLYKMRMELRRRIVLSIT